MSDINMHAVRFHEFGGPEVLKLEQAPRPQPEAGQVLVRLAAAGVNPADWKRRAGLYGGLGQIALPYTPGLEGAGIIETTGPGVNDFHPGQAVYGFIFGAYAEYAVAPASDLLPKPANLTFEEAATAPIGAITAWRMVIEDARVQPGQQVLVHGAAGGVGLYAVQFAAWKGAHVIGTASARHLSFVHSLGAEKVIDYNATQFETAVHDLDAVIDTVGGDLIERSWKTLRPGGVLVSVASQLTPEMGEAHGVRAIKSGRAPIEQFKQISALLESGKIHPVVGAVFPLAQAQQAQELSQTGHGQGRIVLHIQDA